MLYLFTFLFYSFYLVLFFAYLHRVLVHKSVEFSPGFTNVVKTFDWLLTTSYSEEKNWFLAADHIKHHKTSDTDDDPHSPERLRMSEFKSVPREEAEEILKNHNFPKPTALDHFYKKYPYGLYITMTLLAGMFGWFGVPLALFMAWYPDNARKMHAHAHHMWPGYLSHKLNGVDKARNVPYLFFFYGEELHGNHHKWQKRADFAVRKYEVDITYQILRFLSLFGLVTIIGETGPVEEELETIFVEQGHKINDYKQE